jgi:ABC-type sulfate/molybdate transport systems ATPase subunit
MNSQTDLDAALEAQEISLSRGTRPVLQKLSFQLPPGSRRLLLGPSGAGKTSLLRLIAGLERPVSGTLRRGSELWAKERKNTKPPESRRVGMVFQDLALWPAMTALEQLIFVSPQGRKAARAEAEALLQGAGLSGLGGRRPAELSGGEQQRLAVIRALAQQPEILLLDEATAQLDAASRREVLALVLAGLEARPRCSLIAVSHQLDEASFLSEDLWVLSQGQPLAESKVPSQADWE